MRVLNVRLLAILIVCSLVFGSGVFFLHGFQVRRNAGLFISEAEKAKANDNLVEAARNLGWYVRLRPDDIDGLEEYGFLLADLRQLARAFDVLERTVRLDPGRTKVRRKLVDIAITGMRYSDARAHLEEYLLKDSPLDGELLELLGRCQAAVGENDGALYSYQQAIENKPDLVDAYVRLAQVLRFRMDRKAEADKWMKKVVEANPDSADAHMSRGNYLLDVNETDKAMEHARRALELEPDNRRAIWLAARCAMEQEDYVEARKYAKHGIELFPEHVPMYTSLADIELRDKNRDDAIAVLRQGLEATDENPQLLWSMANLLVDAGELDESQRIIDKLGESEFPPAFVGYLNARAEFVQKHWLAARNGFERVRPGLTIRPELVKQADFWLGKAYSELGNIDQTILAYRRALNLDEFFAPARAGIAEALLRAGRIDEAMVEYGHLIKMGKAAGGGAIPWTRMLILKNMNLPPNQRNWPRVETMLDKAEEIVPDAFEIPVLRAEVLAAQNRLEDAEKLLADARDKTPERVEYWSMLSSLAQRRGDWDRANEILAEAEAKLGDKVGLRLARARYLSQRLGEESSEQLRKLAENTDAFSDEERAQLWKGLLTAATQVNDNEQIVTLCEKVAEAEPNNVQIRFLMFEIAVRDKDNAAVTETLKKIEEVEKGPFWLFARAVKMSMEAEGPNDKRLAIALKLLEQARERRPTWSRLPLLAAGIYDQQGKLNQALQSYHEALDMGERNPAAIRRAIELCFREQRFNEASKLLRRMRDVPPELQDYQREVEWRLGNFQVALKAAREAAANSDDYRDHVWLGQILGVMGRQAKAQGKTSEAVAMLEEAERVLRHATELDGTISATWVAMIQFLSSTNQRHKADQIIDNARAALPADKASLALAQCYEALRETEAARKKYEDALAADPDNLVVIRYVADFYLRIGKTLLAEAQFKRIIDGKVKAEESDLSWARRRMAMVLAARGGYDNLQKALALIEQNLGAPGSSVQDKRAKTSLLLKDPSRLQRQQAIAMLEEILQGQRSASPDDQYVLFQLYMAEGAWTKANRQMRSLLSKHGTDPRYVGAYVKALTDHREFDSAQLWQTHLEKLAPEQFNTVSLRAELLLRRGQHVQIPDVLKNYLADPKARPASPVARLRLVADRFEELAGKLKKDGRKVSATLFLNEAEKLFRQFAAENSKEALRLAAFLGRNGQVPEALSMIERGWKDADPVIVGQTCATILKDANVTPEQTRRGEKVIQDALKEFDHHKQHSRLLLAMADVRTTQGRYNEAEAIYRDIIRRNANDPVAMNNLAVLLALQGIKVGEALKMVNRALELAGPMASILDSRASVYMAAGQPEKALVDLQHALSDGLTPVRFFHQAQAYDQAGEEQAAAESIKKAVDLGLDSEMLQPLERPIYDKLRKLLDG